MSVVTFQLKINSVLKSGSIRERSKHMKKKRVFLLLGVIAILCAISLCGCADDEREQTQEGIEHGYSAFYVFTASQDVMQIGASTSVKDYLFALKDDGRIVFEGSEGDYGFFLTSLLGLGSRTEYSDEHSYAGYDWMLYTTLTSIDGTIYSTDDSTIVYNGIKLYKATYGVSGIPCISGQTYALVYEYNSMNW